MLWAAFTYAALTGIIHINLEPRDKASQSADASVAPGPDVGNDSAKRRHQARSKRSRHYAHEALTGDDLGGPDSRQLDMNGAGGEQQLRSD